MAQASKILRQTETAFDVIVSGHMCLDLYPRMETVPLDQLASPGKLFEIGPLDISAGGPVSNTGFALHRLGIKVGLVASVGGDLIGQLTIDILTDQSPELSQLVRVLEGKGSSYSLLLSPENRDRIILHCTGTNDDFGMDAIDFDMVAGAKIFHLGYPTLLPRLIANEGEQLADIYRRAKQTGVVTSLDTALPDPKSAAGRADWRRILERTLPSVDLFVPSVEEIVFMLRRSDYDAWQGDVLPHLTRSYLSALADELLDIGVVIVGFKLNKLGMYLKTRIVTTLTRLPIQPEAWMKVDLWHPAFQVKVVGTTGAGDSAYAGFIAALLRGQSPADTLRTACALGAHNVEAPDALSGIRSWDETQQRIAQGWAFNAATLPEA